MKTIKSFDRLNTRIAKKYHTLFWLIIAVTEKIKKKGTERNKLVLPRLLD